MSLSGTVTLQVLYKLKTAKVFDKSKCRKPDADDDPFAIQHLFLCPESRQLCAVGFTHVLLFRFKKQENTFESPVSTWNLNSWSSTLCVISWYFSCVV